MAEETLVCLCTFPTVEEARQVVRTLVEERLVACGNILPGVESIYRWKDAIETSPEVMVVFKTTIHRYDRFEARLLELHSYEVPEVLALPVRTGAFPYLRWVDECCQDAWGG